MKWISTKETDKLPAVGEWVTGWIKLEGEKTECGWQDQVCRNETGYWDVSSVWHEGSLDVMVSISGKRYEITHFIKLDPPNE